MTEEQRLKRNAYMREWNKRNRERLTLQIQNRRESDKEYRDHRRESYKKNYATHRVEKRLKRATYSAEHSRESVLRAKRWAENNRDRYLENGRVTQHRRRVRAMNATGKFTPSQWIAKLSYYGFRCRYCRCELTLRTATQDHAIPISKKAINWISNIVPACASCNGKKGRSDMRSFLSRTLSTHVQQ